MKVFECLPASATNCRRRCGLRFSLLAAMIAVLALLSLTSPARAGSLTIPNGSFEAPSVGDIGFGINIDSWQDQPQSPFWDPNTSGSWQNLMGLFSNTPQTNADHIDNMDGNQAAFIFPFPGAGIFQDFDSVDWSNTVPPHTFNFLYQPGRSYHVTAAFTSSSNRILAQGSSLVMALYYRDISNNFINIAATNVVYDTNVFTNITHFLDFTADLPTVQSADPWAGQHIGIQFIGTTTDPNLLGGVWDLDHVRLTEIVTPALNTVVASNGQVSFNLQSETGLKFAILSATNITTPAANWTTNAILTNLTGSIAFTDGTTNHQRFYRAHQLP